MAAAGEESLPEDRFARAVGVQGARVRQATEIEVDHATLGLFGRYEDDGIEVAAIVREPGDQVARLGPADDLWFAGILDLREEGRIGLSRRTPRRLRSRGLERPALVLLTRHEEAIAPDVAKGSFGSRRAGVRRETHLFLIDLLGDRLRVMLELEIQHRSEDGFGGHDISDLAVRQRDGEFYLEGVRQDRLPASRARCREPEPYPVRFELAGSRFRELPSGPEQLPAPCG